MVNKRENSSPNESASYSSRELIAFKQGPKKTAKKTPKKSKKSKK